MSDSNEASEFFPEEQDSQQTPLNSKNKDQHTSGPVISLPPQQDSHEALFEVSGFESQQILEILGTTEDTKKVPEQLLTQRNKIYEYIVNTFNTPLSFEQKKRIAEQISDINTPEDILPYLESFTKDQPQPPNEIEKQRVDTALSWIKKEVDTFADEHDVYLPSYMIFDEVMRKLNFLDMVKQLATNSKLPSTELAEVLHDVQTSTENGFDEYDYTTHHDLFFQDNTGQRHLFAKFDYYSDADTGSIQSWNDTGLEDLVSACLSGTIPRVKEPPSQKI